MASIIKKIILPKSTPSLSKAKLVKLSKAGLWLSFFLSKTAKSIYNKAMAIEPIKPFIEVKGLNMIYNQGKSNESRSLTDIDLKIYSQEYVIIFGPSGCGKSTLLYALAGFQKPTSGEVIIDGQDINRFNKKEKVEFHRRKIGMVFQSFFLISTLKILDNICLPKVFIGEGSGEREEKGRGLLERFGIKEQADKFPAELSGGQRQRVAITRALMNDPDILIADEPVGNLDSKASFNVMSILRELNEKDKKTIILVTHDPAHLSFGNKVVHMSDGKIIKIEEVVERKEAVLKGEDEVLVKKETVAPEIKMLMRSFQNFSPSQVGMLLIPFKAQEYLSHILFNVPGEQIDIARNKLQEVISGRVSIENFEKLLDKEEKDGGLNWDKRIVRKVVVRLREIMEIAKKIETAKTEDTALLISKYMIDFFKLNFTDDQVAKLSRLIRLRLDNALSIVELRKSLDRPVSERGMGLDRRTANKIAREMEILMLARFAA
jgi:putative ABC transport system ATP-binding protein